MEVLSSSIEANTKLLNIYAYLYYMDVRQVWSELIFFIFLPLTLIVFQVIDAGYRHLILIGVTTFLFALAWRRHWFLQPFTRIDFSTLIAWLGLTAFCAAVGILYGSTFQYAFRGWSHSVWIFIYVIPISFVQEFIFRKYLHSLLESVNAKKIVIVVIVSLAFAGMHAIYANPVVAVSLSFVMSVLFSTLYLYHPSLLLASLAHAILNYIGVGYCLVALTQSTCLV